jgi:putative DNA primase/helicase
VIDPPSQTAHCNLLLAPDPDEPSLRILAFTRGNLTPPPPALAFRLEPVPGTDVARVAMLGESTRTTEELIHVPGPEARTERDAAKAWLNELLADGPLAARKVEDLAKRAGFAPQTLRRARENLGIVSKRIGIGAGSSYLWSLPPAQEPVAS